MCCVRPMTFASSMAPYERCYGNGGNDEARVPFREAQEYGHICQSSQGPPITRRAAGIIALYGAVTTPRCNPLFPKACQVLDSYHCSEYLPKVAKAPYGQTFQALE